MMMQAPLLLFVMLSMINGPALSFTPPRGRGLLQRQAAPAACNHQASSVSQRLPIVSSLQISAPPENDEAEEKMRPKELTLTQLLREEHWETDSSNAELAALGLWFSALSAFIFINNFIGPWPEAMDDVPERTWFLGHMLGGMLFGGGVILTAALEWLVVNSKNPSVFRFYFDKVPLLDAAIVLPGLTLSMVSGTGLAIERYGGLGVAPPYIPLVFYTLVAFAAWWGFTDLTTQGRALVAVNEWAATADIDDDGKRKDVPKIVELRKISNVVSCLFVVALYGVMVLKPVTLHY